MMAHVMLVDMSHDVRQPQHQLRNFPRKCKRQILLRTLFDLASEKSLCLLWRRVIPSIIVLNETLTNFYCGTRHLGAKWVTLPM